MESLQRLRWFLMENAEPGVIYDAFAVISERF